VLEGRDTGSVVCPQADLKVFLVATSRVRAERRARQVQLPVEQVEQAIVERDSLDSEQSAPAPDAVLIDTGGMDASQVADRIVQLARERV
ncbi:MAG TPA: (d)CMP kinase, partial [Nakamurella sp.]